MDTMVVFQCEHCPASTRQSLIPEGIPVQLYVDMHVQVTHPGTAEPPWVEDDDYLILDVGDAVEEDRLQAQFQW